MSERKMIIRQKMKETVVKVERPSSSEKKHKLERRRGRFPNEFLSEMIKLNDSNKTHLTFLVQLPERGDYSISHEMK